MSKISAEYKEIMEREKQIIKRMDKRVVDAYETEDFLVIVSISEHHIVWEHTFFKLNKKWDMRILSAN